MRLLVSEKRYETPVASGIFRYEYDGAAVGVQEHWRVTTAPDGFTLVRVDFDMRAWRGKSYLFHLVLDGNQQPDRLVYRYLGASKLAEVSGNLLFADGKIVQRQTHGEQTTLIEQAQLPLLLPGVVGLGMLGQTRPKIAVSLDILSKQAILPMVELALAYTPQRTRNLIPLKVGAKQVATTTLGIAWADQAYTIWRDKRGYPVKMQRGDGLQAVETRPMRFRQ